MSRVNDGESGQMRTEDSPLDSVSPQPMLTLTSQCSVEWGRGETHQGGSAGGTTGGLLPEGRLCVRAERCWGQWGGCVVTAL